jgi:hypothetical protein
VSLAHSGIERMRVAACHSSVSCLAYDEPSVYKPGTPVELLSLF